MLPSILKAAVAAAKHVYEAIDKVEDATTGNGTTSEAQSPRFLAQLREKRQLKKRLEDDWERVVRRCVVHQCVLL